MTLFRAIVGKNFGDEGKGLLTNYFCTQISNTLVVKHNGGAQAGHTVETPTRRFVFHELGAGSWQKAPTFWARTFHPDLFKLGQEAEDFKALSGFIPQIFVDPLATITTIDDVLVNMAAESARGSSRHGSCGMGIYECTLRQQAGWGISLGELCAASEAQSIARLAEIRHHYLPGRLRELQLSLSTLGQYGELLQNPQVLVNFVRQVYKNLPLLTMMPNMQDFFSSFNQVLFESGQGLLLDTDCQEFLPHVSASNTGSTNPQMLLAAIGQKLDEVVYVSRSYVTKHGAGHLPHECSAAGLGLTMPDKTNIPNEWQGSLRYATHGTAEEFIRYVQKDLNGRKIKASLALTHLNETDGKIVLANAGIPWQDFIKQPEIAAVFQNIYISDQKYTVQKAEEYN